MPMVSKLESVAAALPPPKKNHRNPGYVLAGCRQ